MMDSVVPLDEVCRVYWASHGCEKRRGHAGGHACEDGCDVPDPSWCKEYFYGEDVDLYEYGQEDPYGVREWRRSRQA